MKLHILHLLLASVLSISFVAAQPVLADDEKAEESPAASEPSKGDKPSDQAEPDKKDSKPSPSEEEKPRDSNLAKRWLERMRALGRRNPSQRSHDKVKAAFRPVVATVRESTVQIFSGDSPTALGAVVDSEGFVLTKASELGDQLVCIFADGRKLTADVVGIHKQHDLAMLKVEAKDLKPVVWSDRDALAIGSWLATAGIDEDPESIGVVSTVTRQIRPQPGVLGVELEEGNGGARIAEVMPRSAALKAGLKKNDIVLSVNGKAVKNREALVRTVRTYKPGDRIRLSIRRGEEEKELTAILGSHFTGPNTNRRDFQNQLGGSLSGRRAGFEKALQHDTVLLPNQCGGPVVDLDGKVVGINIARAGRIVSYALPASLVVAAIDELKSGKLAPDDPLKIAEQVAELDRQITELAGEADFAKAAHEQAQQALRDAADALAKAQARHNAMQKERDDAKSAADKIAEQIEKLKSQRDVLESK